MDKVKSKSRFINLMLEHKPVMDGNQPRNGQEFIIFENKFGQKEVSCILNWKNGFLHSEENIPAVQMEDSHTEYWKDGYLHNEKYDENGNLMAAVYADYGESKEYWINGKRIS